MDFVLISFDQKGPFRRFTFEGIGADRSRHPVVVSADLTLARQHAIQVQNLPLLCRQLLESSDPKFLTAGALTMTDADMTAVCKATRAALDKKKPRRAKATFSTSTGKAWRGPVNAMIAPKLG